MIYRRFMPERRVDEGGVVVRAAQIIGALDGKLDHITQSIQKILLTEIAELSEDAQLMDLQEHTVAANVETVFASIRHRIPIEDVVPPTESLEHARRMAQRGVPANAMVRAYRLGHQEVLNFVLDEIAASDMDPRWALDVFKYFQTVSFGYIDWISQQVLNTYQQEYDRWVENRNSMRAQGVGAILGADGGDVDVLTEEIRYPLRRIHVALALWYPDGNDGDELVRMERFANHLARSLGTHEPPLFLSVDHLTAWVWLPLSTHGAANVTERIREFATVQQDSPWIAMGNPLPGIDGFRRSHEQAVDVRAVAVVSGSVDRRVMAASDPGLPVATLLGNDVGSVGAWVAEILGPLASDTENDERLRETLRVFLRTGSSFKAAADEMHLHSNSIKYRVNRAISRRGAPIADDRIEVEVALLLCHWFGQAVLN
ncbi:ABC transporter substrate-binding protein [Mycolicibacterium phocaicum]|uniref:PucR family transcriptional regulator n=2 Tax=Mycolicibacterium phocaicum TaxID=319706 RepID=A0A7I7ZUU5_9MYCO|nr:PucR family transcriptional regulator [Mycolicibacterium phocaicum]BBZ58015.1 ABC transporter substrate-binding protein [Mycolicibacterium phocaicum]